MTGPNWSALGGANPRLDYAKREAGWLTRLERAMRLSGPLPLDQLRGLPAVDDSSAAGVYFMWHGPVLIYVGQSKCIADRMERHRNKRRTRTTWLAFDHDAVRTSVETDHVRRYAPQFNRTRHG
jgi:hypothetical protein